MSSHSHLRPALLERLTDNHPEDGKESRRDRVIDGEKLKELVTRDLEWLFNTTNMQASEDLGEWPELPSSVINFGIPDLTGRSAKGLDVIGLERALRKAILAFEPRLIPASVRCVLSSDPNRSAGNIMSLSLEGLIWADPMPIELFLKTDLDLEDGTIKFANSRAGRT